MTPSQVKCAALIAFKMKIKKLSCNVEEDLNVSLQSTLLEKNSEVEVLDVAQIPLPTTPYPNSPKSETQKSSSLDFTFDEKCYATSPSPKCLIKDESCYQLAPLSSLDLLQKSYCDSSGEESEVTTPVVKDVKSVKKNLKRKRSGEREEGKLSSPETPSPQTIWNRAKSYSELYQRKQIFGRLSHPASLHASLQPSITPKRFSSSLATPPKWDQSPYTENDLQRRKRFRSSLPPYDAAGLVDLESECGFIDTHCHLDFLTQREGHGGSYALYREQCKESFPKSYEGCLAIFCNPHTFDKRSVWSGFLEEGGVWGSFGCHPHHARHYGDRVEQHLLTALQHPKVRAIGEIGLDYSTRNDCDREVQFSAFRRQLQIGLQRNLPVVIHCREAHEDGMRIAREVLPPEHPIHLHCFTDEWRWAEAWLEAFPKLCLGLTSLVTFPSAECVHQVAQNIPLHRLLLETDAPYFVPRTVKGRRFSHPGMAIHVAAQVAALRSISVQEVLRATRDNTRRLYHI